MLRYLMSDSEWVEFLQWALPRMRMQWPGFRKVRRQVSKRIAARLEELNLAGLTRYRAYLADHPREWVKLDSFCRITISRYYRDRGVFQFLQNIVLPELAGEVKTGTLRCWSCGCASGEEPYTLSLIWHEKLKHTFPETDHEIIATDASETMLKRAEAGIYGKGSVRELPAELLHAGFIRRNNGYELMKSYGECVRFIQQDVREDMPDGPFHLILCRYLVFTYFDEKLQEELLDKFIDRLVPGGALVLGKKEQLPRVTEGLVPWSEQDRIYRKTG